MSSSLDKKLDVLDSQIADLLHKKKLVLAQAKQVARKRDTRRKVLLGALILDAMNDEKIRQFIRARLDAFLTRQGDHELFDDLWWHEAFGVPLPSIKDDETIPNP